MTNPSPSSGPASSRDRSRRRRPRPPSPLKNALLILAIITVFALGVVLSGGAKEFIRVLYGPVPLVIAILLIIQYILLKGRDRSRLYKMELDQVRLKRREETDFLRRLEGELQEIESALEAAGENPSPERPSRSV
ncbi:MAG TPA: hypothetical protein VM492_05185, partial [Sumerlaeia bacterium]|nr:hypothetical protein [Sumerlaeia bacterium]